MHIRIKITFSRKIKNTYNKSRHKQNGFFGQGSKGRNHNRCSYTMY